MSTYSSTVWPAMVYPAAPSVGGTAAVATSAPAPALQVPSPQQSVGGTYALGAAPAITAPTLPTVTPTSTSWTPATTANAVKTTAYVNYAVTQKNIYDGFKITDLNISALNNPVQIPNF